MGKAAKGIRMCLVFVILTAVVVGILYYYYEIQKEELKDTGVLVTSIETGWNHLCQ